jgi:hypothetical protein
MFHSRQCLGVAWPTAAARYRAIVERGLDGDPVAAGKARTVIRELIGGKIDLVRGADGNLYGLQKMALLAAAGSV